MAYLSGFWFAFENQNNAYQNITTANFGNNSFMKWVSDIYLDPHPKAGGNTHCVPNQKLVEIYNPSTQ